MATKKKKVSELPLVASLVGLYTLGVDAANRSVKISLEWLRTAADGLSDAIANANSAADNAEQKANAAALAANTANSAATLANNAASAANTATETANTAAVNADEKASAASAAAQDVGLAIEAANTAATNANNKAGEAAVAANNAISATEAANTATDAAASAAVLASEKVEAAGTATDAATAAAVLATEKAGEAQTATQIALDVAQEVGEATEAANTAAAMATEKAQAAVTATENAAIATTEAISAKEAATTAAVLASEKAEAAGTATDAANIAADRANTAAAAIEDITGDVQSDWDEANPTSPNYIRNKPSIPDAQVSADWEATEGVAFIKNKPTSMPASDVSAWAKAETKPTYSYSEIEDTPVIPANVSELENDEEYQTRGEVETAVSDHNAANDAHQDIREQFDNYNDKESSDIRYAFKPVQKSVALDAENWVESEGGWSITVQDADVRDGCMFTSWPADRASSDIASNAGVDEDVLIENGRFTISAKLLPTGDINIKYNIVS